VKKTCVTALLAVVFLILALCPLFSGGKPESPGSGPKEGASEETVELASIVGMIEIDDSSTYVMPRPIVYFSLVEEIGGEYDFSRMVTLNKEWNYSEYIKLALNLGMRSADGMALYASDKNDLFLENMDTIEKIVGILGIEDSIRAVTDELKKAIGSGDKERVKDLADKVYTEAQTALKEQDNEELAQFMTLGSWIKGAYIMSGSLMKKYDPEVSKVVALEEVAEAYSTMLEGMEELVEYDDTLSEIAEALPTIKDLVAVEENEPVPEQNIQKLYSITSGLTTTIAEMD
jgi:hypothetical protein